MEAPLDTTSFDLLKQLESQRDSIYLNEEKEWRLKSRALWVNYGDSNSKFFHSFASARRNNNTIWKMVDGDGVEATGEMELQILAKNHFQNIYSDDKGCDLLS